MIVNNYRPHMPYDPLRYLENTDNMKRTVIAIIALSIILGTLAYSAKALREINFHKW
jgi:hypothetical protein